MALTMMETFGSTLLIVNATRSARLRGEISGILAMDWQSILIVDHQYPFLEVQ